MKQTVNIIGGRYKGKKLSFPDIEGLRPTPSRVKETLFNWLMHDIKDARCLDVFAGSGSLGFEAFSRGALEVVLLENNAAAFTHLTKIAASFNSSTLQIIQTDALNYLSKVTKSFDIIFLDPPFDSDYLDKCLTLITAKKILNPQGFLYLESASLPNIDPSLFHLHKSKKAGNVFYTLLTTPLK